MILDSKHRVRTRILVVDDDQAMRETLGEVVGDLGDELIMASSAEEARARLDGERFDLVILDKNLDGADGAGQGLDLLNEASRFNPECPVILVTGFADAASIERAFQRGVFDYLEKGAQFVTLLRVKARQALEPARERRLAALANGGREQVIRELWAEVQNEPDSQRKGRKLEELLLLLFRSVAGFETASSKYQSEDEQIDLWIPNQSNDPLWAKESGFFIGECKHWKKPVERKDADVFIANMKRRRARCRLGFYIALGGVTGGFRNVVEEVRREDLVVVILDGVAVEGWVKSSDRNGYLKDLYVRAVVTSHE